jgi:hypothetical protein
MSRITISDIAAAWLMTMLATVPAGCGEDDYAQSELGLDGPVAADIRQLLDALDQTDAASLHDYIRQHGVHDLDASRRQALAASLRQLKRDGGQLRKIDRFGDHIVRAGFGADGNALLKWMLLVNVDDRWKWAGPN